MSRSFGDEAKSFDEIAAVLGLSRSRVYDAYVSGIRKLQRDPARFAALIALLAVRDRAGCGVRGVPVGAPLPASQWREL